MERGSPVLNDRLLTIRDVSEITGLCPAVASVLITESGREIKMHRRKFILESSLLSYLQELAQKRKGNT